MTVLADHASPYFAHTLPHRGPLRWQNGGCHYLLCDASGQQALAAFIATNPAQAYRDLTALPFGQVQSELAGKTAQDHLLAVGSESFLQQVHALAWHAGIAPDHLQCERIGPDLRDVICMQCRAICRGVARRIHICGCGTVLLVRDHFSARRGLYQGAPLALDDGLIATLADQPLDNPHAIPRSGAF